MGKVLPERTVVVAVNRDPVPCLITFESAQLAPGVPVAVLFEERTLRADDGRLTDRFGPLGVHVYEIPPR